MNTNKFCNVTFPEYSEEEAIIALAENLNIAVIAENERFEEADNMLDQNYDQITITVNGIAHGFYLGGPQQQALVNFIEHICSENGYEYPNK